MSNLCKLLDNGWIVKLSRGVDKRYKAFARRAFGQTWEDVLPQIEVNDKEQLVRTSDGIPSQCADAETPELAMQQLVAKVFGLEPAS